MRERSGSSLRTMILGRRLRGIVTARENTAQWISNKTRVRLLGDLACSSRALEEGHCQEILPNHSLPYRTQARHNHYPHWNTRITTVPRTWKDIQRAARGATALTSMNICHGAGQALRIVAHVLSRTQQYLPYHPMPNTTCNLQALSIETERRSTAMAMSMNTNHTPLGMNWMRHQNHIFQ